MLSRNRNNINPVLKKYILNSINNSIDKKYLSLKKENLLCLSNNELVNPYTNISGLVFFLSLLMLQI